jgi:hypothetical protein
MLGLQNSVELMNISMELPTKSKRNLLHKARPPFISFASETICMDGRSY